MHALNVFDQELSDPLVAEQIAKDLHRTFPENVHFRSRFDEELNTHVDVKENIIKMEAVLKAYSVHNKDAGYCQGLNYITGMCLLVTGFAFQMHARHGPTFQHAT